MGKKKGKKKAVAQSHGQMITPQQQQAILELRGNLETELEKIENAKPQMPPPPEWHTYVSEIHREAEDPEETWLKITCKNCAFLLFTKYRDASAQITNLSGLCSQPFGTRSDAEEVIREWQKSVDRAYQELQAKKTVIEPGPTGIMLNPADPAEFTDTFEREKNELGPGWVDHPGLIPPQFRGHLESMRVDDGQES